MFITSAQLDHIINITYQLNEWISLKWQIGDKSFQFLRLMVIKIYKFIKRGNICVLKLTKPRKMSIASLTVKENIKCTKNKNIAKRL